ncbi:hypothetical protein QAD02_005654 [Eretmocerus hayati]|uniref:Uncharacterized protein n=1 Tax=Eretmocerus hayati TaxID=131215 RepID=A0ACC2NTD7_9HYME|nr:hypothetical protein QAD02_005654 [Eretmocerus hayati]
MKTGSRTSLLEPQTTTAALGQRKCCAHCPGVNSSQDRHECSLPNYVKPSLGAGSSCKLPRIDAGPRNGLSIEDGEKLSSGTIAKTGANNASDRFATARKFHAENLQHQPLPDRVDDAIFTVDRPAEHDCMCDVVKSCQRLVPRRAGALKRGARIRESRVPRFAPALGCKKPETWMDLAICWETPVDPVYEPRWPTHIDGSEGGPAPAVFNLVQHTESETDVRDNSIPSQRANKSDEDKEGEDTADLCRNLNGLHLQTTDPSATSNCAGVGATARSKRARFNRHCCNTQNQHQHYTANSARPSSCLQKHGCQVIGRRCNGLASNGSIGNKVRVPRPRTPYARRGFCIDSLAPPFSVVQGCRDADYPEHWRLTSVYRQSYRNPARLRNARTLLHHS